MHYHLLLFSSVYREIVARRSSVVLQSPEPYITAVPRLGSLQSVSELELANHTPIYTILVVCIVYHMHRSIAECTWPSALRVPAPRTARDAPRAPQRGIGNRMSAFIGLLALRAATPVEFVAQAQPNILMIVADGALRWQLT